MIQRQKNILLDLRYCEMTIHEISSKQDVTERTIRNDLKALNKTLEKYDAEIIKNESGKYKLKINNKNKYSEFEQKELLNFEFDYSEPDNRSTYIALRLLFADDYIKLEELMDEMYVSRSSIQNDMKEVRKILCDNDLDLETKPNYGLKIIGSEKNIRNTISSYINEINSNSYLDLSSEIDFMFDKKGLECINDIIIKNIDTSDIKLSDIALNNLVVHIAIAIKRININKYFKKKIESDISNTYEFSIANKIVTDIEDKFDIEFPIDEVYYITMHLMGTKLILKEDSSNINNQDQEIIQLAKDIIDKVDSKIQYNIKNDNELLSSIILHLKPAIYRYKNNMNIRNPLLSSIKLNYPFAYEASIIASDVVEKKLGIKFGEDELGYLAIHLGAAMERAKINKGPIKTLLVCTTGVGSSKLLKYKLDNKFSNLLDIFSTTELYNAQKVIEEEDIDLIISTVPFTNEANIPSIYINDILGNSNFDEIQDFIDKYNNNSKFRFLDIEDIYINKDFKTKEQVIKFLTDQAAEKGKAPENIYESVMERENIATTSFGNYVAIPHPIDLITDETFISIATLKDGVKWADKTVKLVILLCVAKDNNETFEDMYKILLDIIDSEEKVKQIVKSNSRKTIYNIINEGR